MNNEDRYDFWNLGINPILGYRYAPDNRLQSIKAKNEEQIKYIKKNK
jgi:hypothetical protein